MNTLSCPSYEELRAYVAGRLDDEASEAISSHLDGCSDCQTLIATVDDRDDTLLVRLRQAPAGAAYAGEQAYHEAVRKAKALVGSAVADEVPAAGESEEAASGLGQLGEYTLLAKLGEGGMGTVYKALQTKLEKLVAVKILPKSRMEDERAVARFEREMKAIGRLSHPNIVQAFDAREIDGTSVLVMEYVEGINLSHLVREAGPLPVAEACELMRQAAAGLQYAHEHGLVHRDIKPSNLMLECSRHTPCAVTATGNPPLATTADGTRRVPTTLKILDLGLALLGTGQPNGEEMTGSGQAMGTADYMAPEQCCDSHTVDIRADIYSLGCTLYKILTGHAPFSGPKYPSGISKMMAHMQEPAPPLAAQRPDLPAGLVAIVERMMAKALEDRFQLPADVAAALAPLAAGADLAKLAAKADKTAQPVESRERSVLSTDPYPSSALAGTKPSHADSLSRRARAGVRAASPGSSPPRRRYSRWAIAAAAAPLFLLALGVVIWINRTRVEVPDGSTVTVRPDGGVEIATTGEQSPDTDDQPTAGGSPSDEPGQWIDLLALVDLERDVFWGRWQRSTNQLQSTDGTLRLPVRVEGDYQLEIAFRRERDEQVAVVLPVGAWRHVSLILSRGEDAGLEWVNGKNLAENQPPLRVSSPVAAGGGKHTATIRVRQRAGQVAIEVDVDGEPFITWEVDPMRVTVEGREHRLPEPSLGLWVQRWKKEPKPVSFSSARLQMLSGKAEPGFRWDLAAGEPIRVERTTIDVEPETATVERGQPISGIALVSRPSHLPGVQSWTVDTRGHRGAIRDVQYSPDGRWLASAGRDGTIRVLDAKTESLSRVLLGHVGPLRCLAWSPDGKYLASSSDDGTLRYWDAAGGRLLRTVRPDTVRLHRLAWSPDGTAIAFTAAGGQIGLWNPTAARVDRVFDEPGGWAIAWSPDGTRLASTGNYRTVSIWDPATGQVVASHSLDGEYRDPVWSPDGQTIVVNAGSKFLILDALTGLNLGRLTSHNEAHAPTFSPDGSLLACPRWDSGDIELLEMASGRRYAYYPVTNLHLTPVHVSWSPDGQKLASGGHGGWVETVVPTRGENRPRVALKGHRGNGVPERVGIPAWSRDGTEIAVITQYPHGPHARALRVVNLADRDLGRRSVRLGVAEYSVAWSGDGARLITVGNPSVIWSRDLTEQLAQIEGDFSRSYLIWPQLSPNGRLIAVADGYSGNPSTALVDLATSDVIRIKSRTEDSSVVWSPDGQLLVLGKRDGRLVFYDVAARKILEDVKWHEGEVEYLAFSADGRRLASGANDGSVRISDPDTRQPLARRTVDGPVTSLAFSPDGSQLACGGGQSCWLLETNLGQLVYQLDGRADSLAFSGDGRELLGIAADGSRRRWDPTSGKLLADDVAHPTHCSPTKLKWSPDRKYVAASVEGLALHIWRTDDAQPMGAIGLLNDDILIVSPEGHYRTSLDERNDLVYIVLDESGEQKVFTPAEFAKTYGWENDPAMVTLGTIIGPAPAENE